MTMTTASLLGRAHDGVVDEPDPAARPRRRTFTAEYKERVLAEYDAVLAGSIERGALLRREGLYTSHVAEWRKARDVGAREGLASKTKPRRSAEQVELEKLRRKNERLEAELERTRTALEITGKVALRGEGWLAASDSAGGDGIPLDAAAEEESASIVGEVAVAVAEAADLLDEQVDGFGGSVGGAAGGVEGEDLVAPAVDGVRKPCELGDVGVGGVLEEHDQPALRVGQVACGVDLGQEFAGEPDGGDVAVGVAGCEAVAEAFPAAVVEVRPCA